MTLAAAGRITWEQIRAEFGGGNGRVSLADLYLGGNLVREKAANANAGVVNKAAGIPSAGRIALSDFYGKEAAFEYTNPGQSTILYAASLFGTDWPESYKKRVINAGVTERLYFNEGGGGRIELKNNSEIQGVGGVANGGAGTPALYAYSTVYVDNANGAIRGGGGGGGKGGTGGQGGTGYVDSGGDYREPTTGAHYSRAQPSFYIEGSSWIWNGQLVGNAHTSASSLTVGSITYYKGALRATETTPEGKFDVTRSYYEIYRIVSQPTSRTYTSGGPGGVGGDGGRGQGHGQAAAAGSAGANGSAGGTNAGAGGKGGTGGTGGGWDQGGGPGATGAAGLGGNNGGGQAGSAGQVGGASGKAIIGGKAIMVANGTLNGGIA